MEHTDCKIYKFRNKEMYMPCLESDIKKYCKYCKYIPFNPPEFKEVMERRKATIHEPMPKAEKGKVVVDEVVDDLIARNEVGKIKYGQRLRSFNGRNALMDAYQEACDLVMYLKQLLMEQESRKGGSGHDRSCCGAKKEIDLGSKKD